jgi:polygalacturonase
MKFRRQVRAYAALLGLASCLALIAVQDHASAQRRTAARTQPNNAVVYSVRAYGARGDGRTVDTPSVNRAIEAAAAMGGGTVHFPAGTYLCFSIRLKSNVALHLDSGAIILAADPVQDKGSYDQPEPNEWDMY